MRFVLSFSCGYPWWLNQFKWSAVKTETSCSELCFQFTPKALRQKVADLCRYLQRYSNTSLFWFLCTNPITNLFLSIELLLYVFGLGDVRKQTSKDSNTYLAFMLNISWTPVTFFGFQVLEAPRHIFDPGRKWDDGLTAIPRISSHQPTSPTDRHAIYRPIVASCIINQQGDDIVWFFFPLSYLLRTV